ncbi:MAG: hypothetical protein EBZ89_05880 [Chloroflexi bacterium]|nr:hypothetical protein [Chloroflexota bacterium]
MKLSPHTTSGAVPDANQAVYFAVSRFEAFRSTPEMIDDLVKACLSREVTEYGGKPDYHDRTKMPYLSFLAQSAVQTVAREAVNEYIQTMAPAIKQQVKAKL